LTVPFFESKIENILQDLKDNGIIPNTPEDMASPGSKSNDLKPETAQEGNITLDMGDGISVNIPVETHPLKKCGNPVRHAK
jgi:hypothetical protein